MFKNKFFKIGIVLAGYVIAPLAAFAAIYLRDLATAGTDAQASSGMYAFGDSILFLVVFGVLALAPTALGLYFLRPFEKLWTGLALLCLAFSIAGLVAVLANATLIHASTDYQSNPYLALLSLAGVLDIFGAPLFLVAYLLLALIAPSWRSRLLLLVAAGLDLLTGLYMLVNFIFFRRFF